MIQARCVTYGLLAVLLSCTAASAQVIFANADAHIENANVNRNYGSATTLRVRGSSTTWFKTYLRFSLSAVPDLEAVDSVTLSLGTSGANLWNGHTVFVYGLADGHSGENWLEGTGGNLGADTATPGELTWASAPANNTASSNGFTGDATLLGSFTVPAGSSGYFDLSTEQLLNFIQADSNQTVTFMLAGSTGAPTTLIPLDTRLSSGAPPRLTLAVPEPASAAVLLAGMAGLLSRRSRRH